MAVLNGDSGNNNLVGSENNDVLDGGIGADTLEGGAGDDLYIVDNIGDVVREQQGGSVIRVNTSTKGVEANSSNYSFAHISSDGNKVVFLSSASNLVAGDTNGFSDVFIKDLNTGILTRVNTSINGDQANGESYSGWGNSWFANDNKIIFESSASNLVENDTNNAFDIFIKDLNTGVVTRVSTDVNGGQLNGDSRLGTISANGNKIAFSSKASNLIVGDMNGNQEDIFVKDLTTGEVTLINTDVDGVQASGGYYHMRLSADGNKVTFHSYLNNLVIGDNNHSVDAFVKDLNTGVIIRVSTNSQGQEANTDSYNPVLSADGSKVVFFSGADNLVAGDTNLTGDVFVKDLMTGFTTLVSLTKEGEEGNGLSYNPEISADGKQVVFWSQASNLVANDTNGQDDIFVKYVTTGEIARVSTSSDGSQANGVSIYATLSGNKVAFLSSADNLVAGDTNSAADVFIKDLNVSASGIDTVMSSISYTLPHNVENLTLTGSADINGIGNSLNNILQGNSGNNVLDGSSGIDTAVFMSNFAEAMIDINDDNSISVSSAVDGADTLVDIEILDFADVSLTVADLLEPMLQQGADGGETTVFMGEQSQTQIHRDVNGGLDWQQTMYANGSFSQTDYDNNNEQGWQNQTRHLDVEGMLAHISTVNDDGTRDELNLNADGSQPWQEQNRHYDAMGNLDYILTINNDGSMDWQDEDQDNSQTWRTVNSHQSPDGSLDWRRYINDNGTEDWLDLDQDNSQTWTQQATHKNTFGQDERRSVLWDNGNLDIMLLDGSVRDAMVLDVVNNHLWQQNTQHFDSLGAYTGSDILLDTGIAANQLWLRQEGNNLEVSLIGTDQKMLIADWFSGNANTNFSIEGANGRLMANEVQTLVNAMAAFAPPATGQTTLPQSYQDTLGTVIAASWS
ncbi:MAG: PD40 domain-containing protein [Moraxellaceae bacterium]|nr:PD40 domain-containing protein [Moraxellaceae bacterium]